MNEKSAKKSIMNSLVSLKREEIKLCERDWKIPIKRSKSPVTTEAMSSNMIWYLENGVWCKVGKQRFLFSRWRQIKHLYEFIGCLLLLLSWLQRSRKIAERGELKLSYILSERKHVEVKRICLVIESDKCRKHQVVNNKQKIVYVYRVFQ